MDTEFAFLRSSGIDGDFCQAGSLDHELIMDQFQWHFRADCGGVRLVRSPDWPVWSKPPETESGSTAPPCRHFLWPAPLQPKRGNTIQMNRNQPYGPHWIWSKFLQLRGPGSKSPVTFGGKLSPLEGPCRRISCWDQAHRTTADHKCRQTIQGFKNQK